MSAPKINYIKSIRLEDHLARKLIVVLIAPILGIAVLLAFLLDLKTAAAIFDENGPVEMPSAGLWVIAAMIVMFWQKHSAAKAFLFAACFVLFASREIGLHKAFTDQSILKTNYYETLEGAGHILTGLLALCFILVIAGSFIYSIHYCIRQSQCKYFSCKLLLASWVLLIASKILDRFPAKLREIFDITLSPRQDVVLLSLEETLEVIVPAMMIMVFLSARNPVRHT